uniref:Uncharacterized protein n=1 Tax=Arundo donax TaxID=35708 RepID=A0A0A9ET36_ARUDO
MMKLWTPARAAKVLADDPALLNEAFIPWFMIKPFPAVGGGRGTTAGSARGACSQAATDGVELEEASSRSKRRGVCGRPAGSERIKARGEQPG